MKPDFNFTPAEFNLNSQEVFKINIDLYIGYFKHINIDLYIGYFKHWDWNCDFCINEKPYISQKYLWLLINTAYMIVSCSIYDSVNNLVFSQIT